MSDIGIILFFLSIFGIGIGILLLFISIWVKQLRKPAMYVLLFTGILLLVSFGLCTMGMG